MENKRLIIQKLVWGGTILTLFLFVSIFHYNGRSNLGANIALNTSESDKDLKLDRPVTKLELGTDDKANVIGDTSGDMGDKLGKGILSPLVSPIMSPNSSVSPQVLTPSPQITAPNPSPTQKTSTTNKIGRIVVNEIAWAGTEASAADEWIELYNQENYDIDISGWILKAEDGTPDILVEEGKIIKVQGYFLLERTDDSTISSILADQIYTGAISNEGESLNLIDSSGLAVDIIGTTGEMWLAGKSDGNITMERTSDGKWKDFTGNPTAKDADANFINGTPGGPNSQVAYVVTFSSGSSGGSTNPSTASSGPNGSSQTSPTLSPTPTPSPTPSPLPTESPSPSQTPEPEDNTIQSAVINEIAWMGTATSSNDEWIELYNATDQTIDLTGWVLKSRDNIPKITLSGSVSPYGFFLLERTSDHTISDITANRIYTGALGNSGEWLELHDSLGNLKDSAAFSASWPAGDNSTKSSMERINPQELGDNRTNWSTNNGIIKNGKDASGNSVNGTPGSKNSVSS